MRATPTFVTLGLLIGLLTLIAPFSYGQTTKGTGVTITIGGGGGGGSGGSANDPAHITFSGYTAPGAFLTFLSNGSVVGTGSANSSGEFIHTVLVYPGLRTLGIWSKDRLGLNTSVSEIRMSVSSDSLIHIQNIVLSPTITSDLHFVLPGNSIRLYGYAYPGSEINIFNSDSSSLVGEAIASEAGSWQYILDTTDLGSGLYTFKSTAHIPNSGLSSALSEEIQMAIGVEVEPTGGRQGDLNLDNRVDIVDVSILLAHWEDVYNRIVNPNPLVDMNSDGRVDIIDFSILMRWWTG